MQSNIIVTAVVVIYLLVMLLIGYLSSKKIESNTDFVVAGRRLGPFLMAGTLAATEIGGGSSLGVVQQGMESHGLSAAWYIITMGFAFVILTFLAPKFRAAMVKTVPSPLWKAIWNHYFINYVCTIDRTDSRTVYRIIRYSVYYAESEL